MTNRRGWIAARTRVVHHQRRGVVDRQPAGGWPPRQPTGRHERSCPRYFHSFPRALLECCHSCGIAGALNRRCHRGRASGRRAPTPEGQTAPAVHQHNTAHSGRKMLCQLRRTRARRTGWQTQRGSASPRRGGRRGQHRRDQEVRGRGRAGRYKTKRRIIKPGRPCSPGT